MAGGSFTIAYPHADLLRLELSGGLDEPLLLDVETEMRVQLRHAKPGRPRVLVDLSAVSEYSVEARQVLVRMQRFIATRARATAYLATGSEPRALALWVVHMAADPGAITLADHDAADRWLGPRKQAISEVVVKDPSQDESGT